jgi:acyl-CoA dehydrogenase
MSTDWVGLMTLLGQDFATRSAEHDANDSFVAENYAKLKEHDAMAAGVPTELGGGGASPETLCAMIREVSRYCGSTGLAFSMHTHLVGTLAYLWRAGNKAPEGMLRRVASEKLTLISSGGSDWLPGSGKLEKVEGGFRLNARKIFSSGVPAGDILMTTGVYNDAQDGPVVYHFPLSLKAEGVKIVETWRTLGMRGTGSHDIEIKDAFLPDAVMQGVRRPAGKWHPFMHAVALVALPIFYSAYLGVAESAREIALSLAQRKKDDPVTPILLGELENQIIAARIAHASMVSLVASEKPGPATTIQVLARRTVLVNALTQAAEKAMEVGGGAGFFRSHGLERCFRDIQGARYHPIPEKAQTRLTGRFLLGLDIDG